MKKALYLLLFFLSAVPGFSQQPPKYDVIYKLNGEELSGKITEISDTDLKFTYAREKLVYVIKKAEVLKIVHSSGRVEIINKPAPPAPATPAPAPAESKAEPAPIAAGATGPSEAAVDHHNRVAILPFAFVQDGQLTTDVMSEKVQIETHAYLSRHAGVYSMIDPRTTNALLIKAGINRDNIKGYTMQDLCNVLGVEFIVDGLVSVNHGAQTNYGSSQNQTTTGYKNDDREKKSSSSSYSTSTQSFQTSLTLSIYNDKGGSIYSQERRSFLSTQDAYRATLEYLLKRTPLYSK